MRVMLVCEVGGDARDVSLLVLAAFALDAGRIGADVAVVRVRGKLDKAAFCHLAALIQVRNRPLSRRMRK